MYIYIYIYVLYVYLSLSLSLYIYIYTHVVVSKANGIGARLFCLHCMMQTQTTAPRLNIVQTSSLDARRCAQCARCPARATRLPHKQDEQFHTTCEITRGGLSVWPLLLLRDSETAAHSEINTNWTIQHITTSKQDNDNDDNNTTNGDIVCNNVRACSMIAIVIRAAPRTSPRRRPAWPPAKPPSWTII